MKKVSFLTLGCKVNAYDSASMQALFAQHGYETAEFGMPADIIIVNTCTVTAVADKKSRAAIRRAVKNGHVIVTGCLAQRAAEQILGMEGVSAVLGTDGRGRIVEVAEQLLAGASGIDLTHKLSGCGYEPLRAGNALNRTRGVLKIQEGCDCFCSYCIIPYVRGRSRSRDFTEVIDEAQILAEHDVKEIVLSRDKSCIVQSWGKGLGDIIKALGSLHGVRIRLGSLEPGLLGEDFVRQAASADNLCPHFHLSLQSGSESVLKRMNRPYTPKEYMDFLSLLRQAFDAPAVTTDLITGFPGETDEEHAQTLTFVEKAAFSRVHVFPYSPREGTKAYSLKPRVQKTIAKNRAAQLMALGDMLEKDFCKSRMGKNAYVLFEEPSAVFNGCMEGFCERYTRVAAIAKKNDLKSVTLKSIKGKVVFGTEKGA